MCFQFLFLFIPFVYRSSSWRFYMTIHQGFNSFSKFSSRFISRELKLSSYCNPECNFFLPYLWRWYYVLLDNSPSLLRDSQVFKSDIFKSIFFSLFKRSFQPSISSLELSWYRFHLKPSLRNVAIWCLLMTQVISFPS